ncbi:MAG: ECF-type sigma factor, partial [Planctomycetota bacterium]
MSISEDELFQRARDGDNEAVAELLQLHRPRLRKMVAARLNPRIRGRLDESDVIQEAYLEAAKKLPEYLSAPRAPFFLWLRKITSYKIIDAHRRHLVGEGRDAEREVRLNQGRTQMASSIFLAANLMGNLTTPSQALIKLETQAAIHECIDK